MRRRLTVAGRAAFAVLLAAVVIGLLYASLAVNGLDVQGRPVPDPRPGVAAVGHG
jgi:hypothetical protein